MNIVGDNNANTLSGTAFKDIIDGKGGADFILGNDGNDSILGGAGSDQIVGGAGRDTIHGGLDNDNISGGDPNEVDYLYGDTGDDTISVNRRDHADGGDGYDYLAFHLLDLAAVNVDLSGWNSGATFSFAGATVTNFETGYVWFGSGDDKVRAPGFALTVFGGGGSDTLLGGSGADNLYGIESGEPHASDVMKGGDGNDLIYGGIGDLLDGGDGTFDNFELNFYDATADYDINFGRLFSGKTVLLGDGGRLSHFDMGSVQLGSGDDRVKTGSDATHAGIRVTDGGGNDTLIGGAGNDNLSGGQGNDVIRGRGGAGRDIANYQYESAAVTIDLNITGFQNTGGAGMDLLSDIENVYGGQSGDRITGDGGNNLFEGYAGADTLFGGLGDDTLIGGTGGSNDADRLSGGAGQDKYNGGLGADILIWSSIAHSAVGSPDEILALEAADVIDLAGIDADTTITGNQAFTVVSALTGVAGQLAVIFTGSRTEWQMDINGDQLIDGMFVAQGDHTTHSEYAL
jgi:Ca2+-binding RTX toxin-like protein